MTNTTLTDQEYRRRRSEPNDSSRKRSKRPWMRRTRNRFALYSQEVSALRSKTPCSIIRNHVPHRYAVRPHPQKLVHFPQTVAGIVSGNSSKGRRWIKATKSIFCLWQVICPSARYWLARRRPKCRTPSVQSVTAFPRRLDLYTEHGRLIHGNGRVRAHQRADHSARYIVLPCLPFRLGNPSSPGSSSDL